MLMPTHATCHGTLVFGVVVGALAGYQGAELSQGRLPLGSVVDQ
jgi:hypothetical protein